MQFKQIIGHEQIKEQLIQSVKDNRVSHAQLFLGPEGSGNLALAMAFSQYLVCENKTDEDSCGSCPCCIKAQKWIHPDIHFSYPVVTKKAGEPAKSTDFIRQWRTICTEDIYLSHNQWLLAIDAENKQANITVNECHDIIKKLNLKSFESEYKILIMWMPEHLGKEGNVLLKILEEPPEKTLFLLVGSDEQKILSTIISRTQLVKIPRIKDSTLKTALIEKHQLSEQAAQRITFLADGNYSEALQLLNNGQTEVEVIFRKWMGFCLHPQPVELVNWVNEIAKIGRENQKHLMQYSLHFFRELLLLQQDKENIRLQDDELKFAKTLAGRLDFNKAEKIISMLNKAHYYIARNAHPKILFLNFTIRLAKTIDN